MIVIRHRKLRRAAGFTLVALGGLSIWLAPDIPAGIVLLVAGVVLEIVGIALERRKGR